MNRTMRPLFVTTVLTGSFLLFLIQPMFGRMALPKLGGSPSVWNVAMLFYQAALLGGYLYAHGLQRFQLKTQIIIHLGLFTAAAAFLPIAAANWLPDPGATPPALWLLALLAVSIGPVFFIVSAQAPLMQAWFARSNDRDAMHPFFLYAASNLGSLAALLAYPSVVETTTRLKMQGAGWAVGYLGLLALTFAAGYAALKHPGQLQERRQGNVSWTRRLRWTALAFVPSALLLSTTTHLTTDVMAMPLLWVIPLAVYLISFIVAFGKNGERATRRSVALAPILLLILGSTTFLTADAAVLYFAIAGVAMLYVVSLALHGTLAMEKPDAVDLTEFYLWMSVGGALGGLFCAIIAPMIFNWGYEQPILIIVAAFLIPAKQMGPMSIRLWSDGTTSGKVFRYLVPVATLALSVMAAVTFKTDAAIALAASFLVLVAATLSIGRQPQFAWNVLMLMMALGGWRQVTGNDEPISRVRSFFGMYAVLDADVPGIRQLRHGTTLHGVQSLVPAYMKRPMSYYAPESGVGQVFAAAPKLFGPHARMAFIGLGTGTLACYAQPGQTWTAFEIDPAMEAIARNQKLFTYISVCKPDLPVIIGDARLTLGKVAPASYDVLAVDAFSSDAIPLHLMTTEAFGVYQRAVAANGVLLVHVTNRYLDLEPIVAAIAKQTGWTATVRRNLPLPNITRGIHDTRSVWIIMTRTPDRMAEVAAIAQHSNMGWEAVPTKRDQVVWTDDFASILPAIKMSGTHGK